ncbi:hypothetical protein NA57DRAFT_77707 [Rhizodiscina lignyota]|uniref:Uncharacterized protein n=1 Tax=Rhizodiscina lignyota TaxID=1504668 RepID=A0A9P4M545_9PEZI|nr:hypothetical protein NA57DRAFT_77707 [Rhizodiscina lignyota]
MSMSIARQLPSSGLVGERRSRLKTRGSRWTQLLERREDSENRAAKRLRRDVENRAPEPDDGNDSQSPAAAPAGGQCSTGQAPLPTLDGDGDGDDSDDSDDDDDGDDDSLAQRAAQLGSPLLVPTLPAPNCECGTLAALLGPNVLARSPDGGPGPPIVLPSICSTTASAQTPTMMPAPSSASLLPPPLPTQPSSLPKQSQSASTSPALSSTYQPAASTTTSLASSTLSSSASLGSSDPSSSTSNPETPLTAKPTFLSTISTRPSSSTNSPSQSALSQSGTSDSSGGLSQGAEIALIVLGVLAFLVLAALLLFFRKRVAKAFYRAKEKFTPASDVEKAEAGNVVYGILAAPLFRQVGNSLRRSFRSKNLDMQIGEPTLTYTTNQRYRSAVAGPAGQISSQNPFSDAAVPTNPFSDLAVPQAQVQQQPELEPVLESESASSGSRSSIFHSVPVIAGIGSAPDAPRAPLGPQARRVLARYPSVRRKSLPSTARGIEGQIETPSPASATEAEPSTAAPLANLTLAQRAQLRRDRERQRMIAQTAQRLEREKTPTPSPRTPEYALTPPPLPTRSPFRQSTGTPTRQTSPSPGLSTRPSSPAIGLGITVPSTSRRDSIARRIEEVARDVELNGPSPSPQARSENETDSDDPFGNSGLGSRDGSWGPKWPVTEGKSPRGGGGED